MHKGRLSFLLVVALVTGFWWPALWDGKVLIHGDAALVGLPLLRLLSHALHGRQSLLWLSGITGGHPLFAEGQGGFANPLSCLVAYLFDPPYGLGVLHWLSVLIGAGGVYALCRSLELTRWSATFASIAVVFLGTWVASQHNLPVSVTLAWSPWLMLAVERWLKEPLLGRAAWMAIPAALLVFAGYPQVTHGTLLYVTVLLLARVLDGPSRRFVIDHRRQLTLTGLCAIGLAAALSAMQLLPLLELVQLSHRSGGTALVFQGLVPAAWVWKGLLYFYLGPASEGQNLYGLGSIVVALLSGLVLFVHTPPRVMGHVLGTGLLFNLGMASASPLFRVLYAQRLIPGLHSYRSMHVFFAVAVIGLAVIAAQVLDSVSRERVRWWSWWQRRHALGVLALSLYATVALFVCWHHYVSAFSTAALVAPVLVCASYVVCTRLGQRAWFPLAAAVILALDASALRMHAFQFYQRSVLDMPASIAAVTTDPALSDYRAVSMTSAEAMTFLSPRDARIERSYRRALGGLAALPGLTWRIASLDGALALPLGRWTSIASAVQAEVFAVKGSAAPGLRLMDILGVRYVAVNKPLPTQAMSLVSRNRETGVLIYRNAAAKPRFQVYFDAALARSPGDALARLQSAEHETLWLEQGTSA